MTEFKNVKITKMDNDLLSEHPDIVKLLQKAYNNEYLAWLVYEHAAHLIFGPWRGAIIEHFEEHADEESDHADWVGDRLAALGEVPVLDMKILKRAAFTTTDYVEILTFIMQLEGEAVSLYSSMLPLLDNHAAMRNDIEGFIAKEQEHFEDFEKMIRMLPKLESEDPAKKEPED